MTIPVSQALPKTGRMASAETAARATTAMGSSIVRRIASTYPQPKTRAASRGSSQASDAGTPGSSSSQASVPAPANIPLEAVPGTPAANGRPPPPGAKALPRNNPRPPGEPPP